MLIALEGIDGSGKGTQAKALAEGLAKAGHAVELLLVETPDETWEACLQEALALLKE